jgi:nucleoside-diphosphate-sugar epimerase
MGKILVTGAGGFIGSHLTEELVKQGEDVRAFVRYNSRDERGLLEDLPKEIQNQMEVILGDLKDPDGVKKAVKGCHQIFHLGALIAIPYSYVHPFDFIQTNVIGTAHLLNACLENETLERIIHTSTSEVYGTAHDLPIAIIRPFNTFGPRQSLRAIIPTIISQALANKKILLGNIEPRRDFLFVKDTVRGFIELGKCDEAIGMIVNIGTGNDISIGELVKKILHLMGKRGEIEIEERRIRPLKSEVMQLFSDTRMAQRLFGWAPKYTLEDGLKKTIDWYHKNLSRFKVGSYPL